MERAEEEARAEGKTLLVLDAVTGGDAARLYARMGWTTVVSFPASRCIRTEGPAITTYFWKALSRYSGTRAAVRVAGCARRS